jgi:hypothetical protein
MLRRFRPLIFISLVISMSVFTGIADSGQDVATLKPGSAWNAEEREELLGHARATWRSFESMVGPSGLPADRLQPDHQGHWKPSKRTSPTDIASYLWSTLAARALGLINDAETDQRIGTTLATLALMDREHGFFFNLIDVENGSRVGRDRAHPPRPFLSSVDNGWLAVALTMIRNTRPMLRDRADALLKPMNFGFFYGPFDQTDPLNHPGHFHGGFYTDDQTYSTFYGMLNTEPRIISYLAMAHHEVPAEHYYRMYRTLPDNHGRQAQVPQGKVQSYLGVPVFEGHYEYRNLDLVPSWGGSMFEALMVPLFIPEEEWAPKSWGINHPLYVRAQIDQGMLVRRYGFWGFSPSWTPEGGYQTYGVCQIGTEVDGYMTYELPDDVKPKRGKPTGPVFEGVVTPHASFLALRYAPKESLDNLRALIKSFPIFTPTEGFHDSVNVTTGTVSRCVLSLDQGMIMAAIANALTNDSMRKALCKGPIEATVRPIIALEEFTSGVHSH